MSFAPPTLSNGPSPPAGWRQCGPVVRAEVLRNRRIWMQSLALLLGICAAGGHVGSPGLARGSVELEQR